MWVHVVSHSDSVVCWVSFYQTVRNVNLMKTMRVKDGPSPTQQAQSGSIAVGHRVKRPNGFHVPNSTRHFIPSCQETFYPLQILSHHPFPRKISTSAESEVDRHAEQIHCGQRCVWEGGGETKRMCRVHLCACYGEWDAHTPSCYIILRSPTVVLGSAVACECVWLFLCPCTQVEFKRVT